MTRWSLAIAMVLLGAGTARAEDPDELRGQGLDLYKAGKYAEAAKVYARLYKLDNKPETLFTLAQSERLSGDCKSATEHYHKVIELVADFNVARLVQQNLKLCGNSEDQVQPKVEEPAHPDKPATVVHDHGKSDTLAVTLFGTGMLAIGAAGGLYLAGRADDDAAGRAFTIADHQSLQDRAGTEKLASVIALSAGAVCIGVAVFRWTSAKDSTGTVALTPTAGGAAVSLSARW